MTRNRPLALWLGVALVALFAAMAVAPGAFAALGPGPADPNECSLRSPSGAFQDRLPPSRDHWFGTDPQGCDYYARVIHGARASMAVGLVAVLTGGLIALVVGGIAGTAGGWIDGVISRFTDVFYGVPQLVGAILLLSLLAENDRHTFQLALVLGVLGWPLVSRLFRASVRQIRSAPYVDASRVSGDRSWVTLCRHVVPNAVGPVLAYGTVAVGAAITAEAGLSYIGLGLQAPTISWGQMIDSAQVRLADAPHLLFFPSLFLSLAVLGFVCLGDALRRLVSPASAT